MGKYFTRVATVISSAAGRPLTAILAMVVIIVWAVSGPMFAFSDTWQLVINTGTTIVTFLMVFLIQNTQNRDAAAMQAKLDELIRSIEQARGQFIAVMATMMRRILIDHARARRAAKRDSSGHQPVLATDADAFLDVLAVDEALTSFAAEFPRQAEAVQLRFFGGLSSPEIAKVLDISLATVERDWRFSKAWLLDALGRQPPAASPLA